MAAMVPPERLAPAIASLVSEVDRQMVAVLGVLIEQYLTYGSYAIKGEGFLPMSRMLTFTSRISIRIQRQINSGKWQPTKSIGSPLA